MQMAFALSSSLIEEEYKQRLHTEDKLVNLGLENVIQEERRQFNFYQPAVLSDCM